jgi:hypothetical protein
MGEEEKSTAVPQRTEQTPAAPQQTLTSPAAPTLREEMRAAEDGLTDTERKTLKTTQQELIGKFLVIGCVWGMILGGVISKFLLQGTIMNGVYSGIVIGMLLGVGAGLIFGALEKAMLLQHVGKYAPKAEEPAKPQAEEKK